MYLLQPSVEAVFPCSADVAGPSLSAAAVRQFLAGFLPGGSAAAFLLEGAFAPCMSCSVVWKALVSH